jgi:hypothetical protein
MAVREMSGDDLRAARSAGLNRTYWDLRHQPIEAPRGGRAGGPGGGGGSAGPFVLPADYRVTLTVDGREAGTRTVRVLGDPEAALSDADRKAQHGTALMLHELQRTMGEMDRAIAAANDQVRAIQDLLKATPVPTVATAADAAVKRLADLARQLGPAASPGGGRGGGPAGPPTVRSRVSATKNQIMGWTAKPTVAQARTARDSRNEVARIVGDLNHVTAVIIPALYKAAADVKLKPPALAPFARIKLTAPPR